MSKETKIIDIFSKKNFIPSSICPTNEDPYSNVASWNIQSVYVTYSATPKPCNSEVIGHVCDPYPHGRPYHRAS